ncbi:MAG: hypothetical protein XD74_2273, partial [Actinobacteria bacterium 66_15]
MHVGMNLTFQILETPHPERRYRMTPRRFNS